MSLKSLHDTFNLILRLTLILMVIWAIGDFLNTTPMGWGINTGKAIQEWIKR